MLLGARMMAVLTAVLALHERVAAGDEEAAAEVEALAMVLERSGRLCCNCPVPGSISGLPDNGLRSPGAGFPVRLDLWPKVRKNKPCQAVNRTEQIVSLEGIWVAWDTASMDVVADGLEGQVKHFARGEVTILCGTEADWRRAVKSQDPARMMSGNPPRRNGSQVLHLLDATPRTRDDES